MLVAIGVAFIMLTTAVFTIHLVLRAERTTTGTFEYTRSITRLTRSFRSDVHAARDARLVPAGAKEPSGVEVVLSNRSILYTVSDIGIERVESEGDQIHRRFAIAKNLKKKIRQSEVCQTRSVSEVLAVGIRMAGHTSCSPMAMFVLWLER